VKVNSGSIIRLFSLAAIWGASFLFMRIAVPELGPAWLMFGRVLLAALLSFFNTALPFLLFAYAAQTLTASLLAVLNATAPCW
jgi:hypothetical protein